MSDGELTPSALADVVADAGIGVLALTDHDTTAGHREARVRCEQRNVLFVPGIEMTAYAMGRVIHVLGLGLRDDDAGIARSCSLARENFARNQQRWIETLAHEGHDVSWQRDFAEQAVRLPTLIERLCSRGVEDGDPQRMHASFSSFFRGLPQAAYAELPSPAEAAGTIRAAGGVAVLAHPYRIDKGHGWQALLDGMDAVEAMYAAYDRSARDDIAAVAHARGLLISCGSDYHGYFQGRYINPGFEASPELLARLGINVRRT